MGCCGHSNKNHSIVNTLNPQDGIVLKIEGMNCGHCKSSVEKALLKVPGVKQDTTNKEEIRCQDSILINSSHRWQLPH